MTTNTNHRLTRRPFDDEWHIFTLAIQHFACERCGAQPTESCRTYEGTGESYNGWYAHKVRRAAIDDIFERGHRHGLAAKRIKRAKR